MGGGERRAPGRPEPRPRPFRGRDGGGVRGGNAGVKPPPGHGARLRTFRRWQGAVRPLGGGLLRRQTPKLSPQPHRFFTLGLS